MSEVMDVRDDTKRFVPRWSTKEAANHAKISVPTVRRYAKILERECNYQFHTLNDKGERCFSDHDITLLTEMKRFSHATGMTLTNIAKMVVAKYGYGREEDNTVQIESAEADLAPVPQDFHTVVERASHQFWEIARKEIMKDVREVMRDEIKNELRVEMDDLKHQLAEIGEATRQIAASLEKQKKPWWKRGR
jgi:DNA-binding transcriptional MerR regulator